MNPETPSVGVMLGNAGGPVELVCGNKTWRVSHPDQAAKARLEKLYARDALEQVRQLKDVLDPGAYKEAFAEATRNLKDYKTWQPGWQSYFFDPRYAHYFLWSLLLAHHPDCSEADAVKASEDYPEEVRAAVAQVLPDFFTLLMAEVRHRLDPAKRAELDGSMADVRALILSRLSPTPQNST